MVSVLSPSGIESPDGGENHSRAMLSRNWGRINSGLSLVSQASGTIDSTNVGGTSSTFTRIRIGNTGFIVAHIVVLLKTALVLPANTASNIVVASGFIPAGYRPPYTIGNELGVLSGAGRGDIINFQFVGGDQLTMRSGAAGFTTTAGVSMIREMTWQWDGVL